MDHFLPIYVILIGFFVCLNVAQARVKCPKDSKCAPLVKCNLTDEESLLYPCSRGKVCCPSDSYTRNNKTELENRKVSLFPEDCGIILTPNKISGGKRAEYGQFPWMALLGYRQSGIDINQFLCGGSLITQNYILTAAHCLNLDSSLELVLVRLGEHDISTEKDCYKTTNFDSCADPHIDLLIEKIIKHPVYQDTNLQNDIGLVKTKTKIKFTDFIRPICLPFTAKLPTDLSGHNFTISGWGKTSSSNLGGSPYLQYASVTVWKQARCGKKIPPEVRPLSEKQLCANGPSTEDACKGDSGGPLVNFTMEGGGEPKFYQVGIVSFASTLTCGDPTLPTVYTRIDRFLEWIQDSID